MEWWRQSVHCHDASVEVVRQERVLGDIGWKAGSKWSQCWLVMVVVVAMETGANDRL